MRAIHGNLKFSVSHLTRGKKKDVILIIHFILYNLYHTIIIIVTILIIYYFYPNTLKFSISTCNQAEKL